MEKKETTEAGTVSISQDRRYDLKLRALIMLYEERLTQTEIARQLNISRVTLGKLLEEAKKEGMIRFEIVDVRGKRKIVQLEKRMRQTFGLRDVRLVDCPNADDPLRARRIAEEAASYVGENLKSGMKIGLTWGRTLNAMTLSLTPDPAIRNLQVYTLVGGASMSLNFQPAVLAERFIHAYDGQAVVITAPFMCQHAARRHRGRAGTGRRPPLRLSLRRGDRAGARRRKRGRRYLRQLLFPRRPALRHGASQPHHFDRHLRAALP